MISLCLTENVLKRPRKATSSVAAYIYTRRPFLKATFQLQGIYYLMLSSCYPFDKIPPILQREKKQLDFHVLTHSLSRTTVVNKPQNIHGLLQIHPTGSEYGKALIRQCCLRDEIPQEQSELSLNLPAPNHIQNWRDLQRDIRTGTSIRQSEMSLWTVL